MLSRTHLKENLYEANKKLEALRDKFADHLMAANVALNVPEDEVGEGTAWWPQKSCEICEGRLFLLSDREHGVHDYCEEVEVYKHQTAAREGQKIKRARGVRRLFWHRYQKTGVKPFTAETLKD